MNGFLIGANTNAPGIMKEPLIFGPEGAVCNLLKDLLFEPPHIRNYLTSAIM